jgi:hypothetical protein
MFRNMRYARWTPDETKWPKAARWIARVEAHPAMAKSIGWSDALMRTTVPGQRAVAAEIGVPLTDVSFLRDIKPVRGPMSQV